ADLDAAPHARAAPVGLVVHLAAAERREVAVVPEAQVELSSEHGRDGPLLRHPGEGMRERCEDVDLHEETLVGLGETTRHQDAAALEVDFEDTLRDAPTRVRR